MNNIHVVSIWYKQISIMDVKFLLVSCPSRSNFRERALIELRKYRAEIVNVSDHTREQKQNDHQDTE